jgi:plasmid replication initiation protein
MAKENTTQAIVKKNIGAIHIAAKLSLVERKISNALLFNAYENLLLNKIHSIDIKTMSALIGFDSKDIQLLKNAIIALETTLVQWNVLDKKGKEGWESSTLLAWAGIKDGILSYEYSTKLSEKFYNPEVFARINLSIQKNISSNYTLILYETCLRFLGTKSTGWIELDKFRAIMGITGEKTYSDFKHLNNKIIKPSIIEINRTTNIFIEVEYKRYERAVSEMRFSVKENSQLTLLEMEEGDDITTSHAYTRLLEKGVSKMVARQWIIEYGESYVLEKLDVTEQAKAAGKLKSVGGFLSKAIAENYTSTEVVEKKVASAAKQKRDLKASLERKIEALRADILKVERANRQERGRIIEVHLAALSAVEESVLRDAFLASIDSDFHLSDFREKRWASSMNAGAIVHFVAEKYSIALPLSDDTAQALKTLTIPELNAEIATIQNQIDIID